MSIQSEALRKLDPRMEFAKWLERELKDREMSQAELARRAGVTRAAINKVINGYGQPGTDLCRGIARAFGLAPETVFRQAELLPPAALTDELDAEILHLADKMTDQEKDELRDYANLLLARRKKNQVMLEHNS